MVVPSTSLTVPVRVALVLWRAPAAFCRAFAALLAGAGVGPKCFCTCAPARNPATSRTSPARPTVVRVTQRCGARAASCASRSSANGSSSTGTSKSTVSAPPGAHSLLIAQRLDRSQGRRPARRVTAEEQPDRDRHAERQRDRAGHDDRLDPDDRELAA